MSEPSIGIEPKLLWKGFDDPAHQAQRAFRALMLAMSEPGTLVSLKTHDAKIPSQHAGIFTTALTLLDQNTNVWLSDEMASDELVSNLKFHCGCIITNEPADAQFAFLTLKEWQNTEEFNQGSEDYPHLSTTLIIQVAHLQTLSERADLSTAAAVFEPLSCFSLSGPGIENRKHIALSQMSKKQVSLLTHQHAHSPLGTDILLISGETLIALPRSTRISAIQGSHDTNRSAKEAASCM